MGYCFSKAVHLQSPRELEQIAKQRKLNADVTVYELAVKNYQGDVDCVDDSIKPKTYYIPLKHLFSKRYGSAIVSFIDQNENLILQITVLPPVTTLSAAGGIVEWTNNYTYRKPQKIGNVSYFADLHHQSIEDYVIVYTPSNASPILLSIAEENSVGSKKKTSYFIWIAIFALYWAYIAYYLHSHYYNHGIQNV